MFGSCIVLLKWGLICKTFENSKKLKIANLKKKLHVNTSKTKHLCGHSYLCARIISDGIP